MRKKIKNVVIPTSISYIRADENTEYVHEFDNTKVISYFYDGKIVIEGDFYIDGEGFIVNKENKSLTSFKIFE